MHDVPDNIKMPDFEYGEHVVCVWHDEQENQLSWFLGIVVAGEGKVNISMCHLCNAQTKEEHDGFFQRQKF